MEFDEFEAKKILPLAEQFAAHHDGTDEAVVALLATLLAASTLGTIARCLPAAVQLSDKLLAAVAEEEPPEGTVFQ